MAKRLTIEELNNVRLHIEPEVARLAAKNISSDHALRLQNAIAGEHMAEAIDERTTSLTKVHLVLAKMWGNFFHEFFVNALLSITREIIITGYREGDMVVHGTNQHDDIVKAILESNPDEAARAMRVHLKKYSENDSA